MKKYKSLIFNIASVIISFICLVSMYVYPDTVKNAAYHSLKLCAKSIIPSLFPYITCTRIFSHLALNFIKKGGKEKIRILGFSPSGFFIHILGLISGFPGGAVLSTALYKSGAITKKEAERLVAFSNCISPAFCILYFGREVMKSTFCAVLVFLSVVASNLICIFLLGGVMTDEASAFLNQGKAKERTPISTIIADCCLIMVNICAYITFFTCIGSLALASLPESIKNSAQVQAITVSLLEITAGTEMLMELPFGKRLLLGSALMSFGGISAIMQVMSVCERNGISAKKFILVKLVSAIFSPLITFLLALAVPYTEKAYVFSGFASPLKILLIIFVIAVITTPLAIFVKFCKKVRKKQI